MFNTASVIIVCTMNMLQMLCLYYKVYQRLVIQVWLWITAIHMGLQVCFLIACLNKFLKSIEGKVEAMLVTHDPPPPGNVNTNGNVSTLPFLQE